VRLVIFKLMSLKRRVSFVHVKVRRFDHHDFGPRSHGRWRDILPGLAVVVRQMNQAVVGADPDQRRAQRRRRNRINYAAPFLFRRVRGRSFIQVRRRPWIFTRHVLTDLGPALAAVRRLVEKLIAVIERVRIGRREHQRLGPIVPVSYLPFAALRAAAFGANIFRFARDDEMDRRLQGENR